MAVRRLGFRGGSTRIGDGDGFGSGQMRIFELKTSLWLPKPLDDVFPFFADARNLEALTPPWLHFEVLTPAPISMAPGTTIDYRLRLRGLPIRWQSEITAWEPPHRFVDEQRRGPYRLWVHEHRFREQDGQTLAEDHIRYAAPGERLLTGCWLRATWLRSSNTVTGRWS